MNIRPFAHADIDAVVQLWRDCALVKPWNDPYQDIARKLAVSPELFLVGELTNQGVTTLVASAMFGYEGHRGWVNYLAVAPAFQRQGMAAQLMAAGEALLLSRGCPKINLQVRSSNLGVIAMYEKLGYTQDAVISLGKRLVADPVQTHSSATPCI
ncbi:MAG: GNAT family acetyltransferase [Comamonadaceae bacterium]|nr:GNAT family acetyltransferase [Comamonadaceae bacterium]